MSVSFQRGGRDRDVAKLRKNSRNVNRQICLRNLLNSAEQTTQTAVVEENGRSQQNLAKRRKHICRNIVLLNVAPFYFAMILCT